MKLRKSLSGIIFILFLSISMVLMLGMKTEMKTAMDVKKVLQDAAYSASLSGTQVIDLDYFENKGINLMKEKDAVIYIGNSSMNPSSASENICINTKGKTFADFQECINSIGDENLSAKQSIQLGYNYLYNILADTNKKEKYDLDDFGMLLKYSKKDDSFPGYDILEVTYYVKYKPFFFTDGNNKTAMSKGNKYSGGDNPIVLKVTLHGYNKSQTTVLKDQSSKNLPKVTP